MIKLIFFRGLRLGCLWVCCGFSSSAEAVLRVPRSANEVLTKLPSSAVVRRVMEDRRSSSTQSLTEAVAAARNWIEQGRADLDPRHLGRAEAVLARWWTLTNPPNEVRLLRATIRQSLHDFSGALADLSTVTRDEPLNAQAWLTRCTLHTVRGEWIEARESALRLAPLTGRLTAAAAAASVSGVNGQLEEACELLQAAMRDDRGVSEPALRLWSLTLLGEMFERRGRAAEAERYFKHALSMRMRDAYLLAAYGDFLIESDRCTEVVELLKEETRADGLLLRLALAEQKLNPNSDLLSRHVELLQERFASAKARGDRIHQREEAIFQLHLKGNSAEALLLAQENWRVQREPSDVKILLEAAITAGHTTTVNQVRQWLQESELQDARVERLLRSYAALR